MSLLISSVMTFGRMAQQNEITALKSAGVNLYNIIKPALWFGAMVATALCFFNNFILPEMNYNADFWLEIFIRKNQNCLLNQDILLI